MEGYGKTGHPQGVPLRLECYDYPENSVTRIWRSGGIAPVSLAILLVVFGIAVGERARQTT